MRKGISEKISNDYSNGFENGVNEVDVFDWVNEECERILKNKKYECLSGKDKYEICFKLMGLKSNSDNYFSCIGYVDGRLKK